MERIVPSRNHKLYSISNKTKKMKNRLTVLSIIVAFSGFGQAIVWGPEITVSDGSLYGSYRPRATIVQGDVPVVIYGRLGSENIFISRWNGSSFDAPTTLLTGGESSYISNWTGPDIGSKGDTIVAVFKLNPLETGNVYSVRSTDGGVTFSDTIRVDDHDNGVAWMPSMEMDENGNPVVACMIHDANWANPRYALINSNDAGLTYFGENEVTSSIPGETCDCCASELAIDGQRQLLIYRNNESNIRDIFGVLSTDGGATFPSYTNLDNLAWSLVSCPSTGADAVFMGDTVVTAYASAGGGIYRVYVSTASITSGLVFETREMMTIPSPSQGTQNYPRISQENDTIVLAWTEMDNLNNDIFYSVSVPGVNTINALTQFKYKGNLTTSGAQTTPEIIYKNGLAHLFYQDNSTGNLIYRRGTIDVHLGQSELSSTIHLFPNPSKTGTYKIQGNLNIVGVTDLCGKSIKYSSQIVNGGSVLRLENAMAGVYFLIYEGENGVSGTQRLCVD